MFCIFFFLSTHNVFSRVMTSHSRCHGELTVGEREIMAGLENCELVRVLKDSQGGRIPK